MNLAFQIDEAGVTDQRPFALNFARLQAEQPERRLHTAADCRLVDAIAPRHLLAGSQPEQGVKGLQQVSGDQNASAFKSDPLYEDSPRIL